MKIRLHLLLWLLMLPLTPAMGATAGASSLAAAHVLLLLSYEPLFPAADNIVNTVQHALNRNPQHDITLHVEFMDSDLQATEEYFHAYAQLLRAKQQQGERYDLVIVAGDGALKLVAAEGREVVGQAPVVFLGVSDSEMIRHVQSQGGYTGIYDALPVYEFMALMRYLYPGFQQLHVINDGLPRSAQRLLQLQQAADSLSQKLVVHSLATLSWQQLADELSELRGEPLLLLSAYQDADKQVKPLQKSNLFISNHSGSPLWSLSPFGIGDGLLGGVVTDMTDSAGQAADMALRILAGENPDRIAVDWHPANLTLIDAELAARAGFDHDDFPQKTTFVHEPPGFWQNYRNLFLLLLSVTVFFTSIGLFIWSEIRRRKFSDQQLDDRTELIKNILDSIPDIIFYKDRNGIYVFCNKQFVNLMGKDPVGHTDFDVFDQETAAFFRAKDKEAVARKHMNVNEEWVHGVDGSVMLLETQKTPIYDKRGRCIGVFGLSRDITELKKAQQNLEHIAHHDVLTGLPNRLSLNKKLEYALNMARRGGELLAVIFLDLDRFKDINDTIGHDIGDLLLKDVAHRLHNNVRDSDICARLGGDEFVVVLSRIDGEERIQEKCDQLLQVISRPYSLQGHLLSVFASAGISIYPQHGNSVDELIRNADAALHKAKELGRNRSFHYQRELTDSIHSRMSLEQDLRSALESHSFMLNYQPQFRVGEAMPRRVEALLRWPHPVRGLISPHDFIPLAETSGMIVELGYWVLRSACQQFLFWRQQGLILDKISVNVSPIQINSSFASTVADILQYLDFDPRWLELEVTESLMMSGTTEVSQQISELRAMGVDFAIDDFGTGYSSLSKIKSMPVTVLKIDQSFVRDINDDINDYEIARAIVLMAKSLGLIVVAEGVENKEQEGTLHRLGCEWVQGYYYAMPMDGEAFYQRYFAELQ
ncbi:EAL domain-containing protein [Thalassolituus sp. C2-1]|uniref:EAL domain-containing protein n=1 Tax=Venatorbacter sp. C2-1 TaxID=2597518 RepID=UPI001196B1D9|nr:EAL domain-containing protein [Thalassolituus sp. C2-1]TVV44842.1 EAL domain-containing protein [Thalassolituus sp. C2-1]